MGGGAGNPFAHGDGKCRPVGPDVIGDRGSVAVVVGCVGRNEEGNHAVFLSSGRGGDGEVVGAGGGWAFLTVSPPHVARGEW